MAAFVPDLFFATRIAATAAHAGIEIVPLDPATATTTLREWPVSRAVVDLTAPGAVDLIRALRGDAGTASLPIVAFYPHVARELRDRALAAGADRVLPRSAFTARLAAVLRGEGLSPGGRDC